MCISLHKCEVLHKIEVPYLVNNFVSIFVCLSRTHQQPCHTLVNTISCACQQHCHTVINKFCECLSENMYKLSTTLYMLVNDLVYMLICTPCQCLPTTLLTHVCQQLSCHTCQQPCHKLEGFKPIDCAIIKLLNFHST